MSSPGFSRLLVATEFPPNASGGGPAVVRQMLKHWPVEKLFWWSCHPETNQKFGQQVAGHQVATIPPKLYPHRRARLQKSWLLEHFWTPWAAYHFQKTLGIFQPDVVWAIPHGWSIPPLNRTLLQSQIPFHVSIHDYADVRGHVESFGLECSRRLAQQVDQLYARANTRDAICQPMVADLQARTGASGMVNHAGLEPEDFTQLSALISKSEDCIRIGYAGTILVEAEFALFVAALQKVRRQIKRPVTLEFCGSHSYRSRPWFDGAWMTEHGNLTVPKLAAALQQCTWGFSPMALTDADPRYNRFSLPTKFVSYLSVGLPIITLGHPESSVVKLAAAYDVGLCSSCASVDALAAELLSAFAEPDSRQKYKENLRRCARQEFDADRMRQALHSCLAKPE